MLHTRSKLSKIYKHYEKQPQSLFELPQDKDESSLPKAIGLNMISGTIVWKVVVLQKTEIFIWSGTELSVLVNNVQMASLAYTT